MQIALLPAGDARLVAAEEGVALAHDVHVLVAVQHDAHGAPQVPRRHRDRGVHECRARLLAAEPAADALRVHHHLVHGDAQHPVHRHLVLRRRLQFGG